MDAVSQERARFAYEKAKNAASVTDMKEFSSFVASVPAMILHNGLGHTMCFLLAKSADQKNRKYKKNDKHWLAFEALSEWLEKKKFIGFNLDNPAETVKTLVEKDALQYMAVQEEALRFFEWFKVMTKMFIEGSSNAQAGQYKASRKRRNFENLFPLPGEIKKIVDSDGISNFGLYFNKWLCVKKEIKETFEEGSERKEIFESFSYEFQAGSRRGKTQGEVVLERYSSIKDMISRLLTEKHKQINELFSAFKSLGYEPVECICRLKTSLILGLGNAHPTERGFVFHWTLGIPYIPAEGFKGVMRLAYLVNRARKQSDFFRDWACENENFWRELAQPFGRAENDGSPSERGKVIFLDVYPMSVPKLMLEIVTCHYSKYYGGERGPTEDQNPNPLPFLAIAPGAEFRFLYFVREDVTEGTKDRLKEAFSAAISEHGFGAKTSVGHGRFYMC